MGYGVSKRSSPGDMAISHAAEPLPSVDGARPAPPPAKGTGPMVPSARACAEPARTNGGSEWECQLCTFLSAAGKSSYRICRAPLFSLPPGRCRQLVQPFSRCVPRISRERKGATTEVRCPPALLDGTGYVVMCFMHLLQSRRAGAPSAAHAVRRERPALRSTCGSTSASGEMVGAGRSRPLTPAGRRRATGSAAAAEARCICCMMHQRASCCMLSFGTWAGGSQRRRCGGALAWTWEVV